MWLNLFKSLRKIALNLIQKTKTDVRYTITRKQHFLYKKMDLASIDLNELVGFQTSLETIERHFAKYDLLPVFQILNPEKYSAGKILMNVKPSSKERNLFQWYTVLTIQDILASNQWCHSFPTEAWYSENMGITYEYFKTHMVPDLWTKVNEEYNKYPSSQKGGSLLLYLMIHQLIAANDSLAAALSDKIDAVKISSYKGEDVGEAVTHLRALLHRLKNMRRRHAAGNEIDLIPLDLSKRLYKMFQTSSSTEFNRLFANRYSREFSHSLITGSNAWTTPDDLLTMAQHLYLRLRLTWCSPKQSYLPRLDFFQSCSYVSCKDKVS
jgi:hypothetical protein